MSFHLTKLAMNADFKDDPVAKNVMIALCWSYFDNAPHGTLNEDRICRRTAYKKRTVQDALARLKAEPEKDAAAAPLAKEKKSKGKDGAWGLISIDYFGVGSGTSPKYTINEARLEAMQFPEQLSLKLTALRAVKAEQKDAAAAPFAKSQHNEAKDAAAASFPTAKDAADAQKGAAAASYTWNSHSSYNPLSSPEPTGAEGGKEAEPTTTKSRYTAKQWFAYTKSQPDITNPFAYVNSRISTTVYDSVLELWLEQQQPRQRPTVDKNCEKCRGTGWELVSGKGVKPCACRAVAQAQ